ncbi:MAG: CinA family protein [Alphaproteobacteria bacterium]
MQLATVESCTGGLVAACLTAIPGSSDVVERGFVTYSNAAKAEEVGVDPQLIERVGAVSAEVAEAMAAGAVARTPAGLALSITGIAGPGGGSDQKPVGLVYIGCALENAATVVQRHVFPGDRDAVRSASVRAALDLALSRLASH